MKFLFLLYSITLAVFIASCGKNETGRHCATRAQMLQSCINNNVYRYGINYAEGMCLSKYTAEGCY